MTANAFPFNTIEPRLRRISAPIRLTTGSTAARRIDRASKPPAYVQPYIGKYRAIFEKDALRVGKWHTDSGAWKVTRKELARLCRTLQSYRLAGNSPINLTWDHSESARDVCGDVLDARLVDKGGELVVLIGTNDPSAIRALSNGMPVSIQATPKAEDGRGNRYPILLTHVALCQRPVVTKQRPAVRWLSRGRQSLIQTWRKTMPLSFWLGRLKKGSPSKEKSSGGEAADAKIELDDDAVEMPVTDVVELLNEHFDAELSERISTVKELSIALETLAGDQSDDDEEEADSDVADKAAKMAREESAPGEEHPLVRRLAAAEQANTELRERLARQEEANAASSQRAFSRRVDALCESGAIAAGVRGSLMQAGAAAAWNLSLLTPFQKKDAALPLHAHTRPRREAAEAPVRSVGETDHEPTQSEERRKRLSRKVMGLAPVND